ncbi:Clp protease N-terminal domain-containing protein [Streptomyces sp. NPDC054784]
MSRYRRLWSSDPVTSPTVSRRSADSAPEELFSGELTSALAGARRRAARDADRQVDTAHLLHSLLESDPGAWELIGADGSRAARLLGYLAQRSIGYGLRWQGSVEDSGALPAIPGARVPGWSPAAAAALERALWRAHVRDAPRVEGVDLLAALAEDGDCRAAEVLARVGVEVAVPTYGADPHL